MEIEINEGVRFGFEIDSRSQGLMDLPAVTELVEELLHVFIEPAIERNEIGRDAWILVKRSPGSDGRSFGWDSKSVFLRTLIEMREGAPVRTVAVTVDHGLGDGIELSIEHDALGTGATVVRMRMPVHLALADQDGIDVQRETVAVAKQLFAAADADTGYIAVGRLLDQTPYESRIPRSPESALLDVSNHLRGVFWGNFLSEHHIERLGGKCQVVSAARFPVVDVLVPRSGRAALYLQASPDLFSASQPTDEQWEALQAVLPGPNDAVPSEILLAVADAALANALTPTIEAMELLPQSWFEPEPGVSDESMLEVTPSSASAVDGDGLVHIRLPQRVTKEEHREVEQLVSSWSRYAMSGEWGHPVHRVGNVVVKSEGRGECVTVAVNFGNDARPALARLAYAIKRSQSSVIRAADVAVVIF